MQAAINRVVTLEFDLFDAESNELIESTQGFDPMQALLGHGDLSPGMEQALLGKSRGDRFEATIPPEQGYGTGERLRTQTVSRELFEGMQPKVGTQFQAQTERGIEIVTVTAVDGDQVTIDANHPLAGHTLRFRGSILEVREASEEEVRHGHVHLYGHEH
jgi:FKBP-type peptidyl-prolyl cis-trans isomerase SlyD